MENKEKKVRGRERAQYAVVGAGVLWVYADYQAFQLRQFELDADESE